MSDNRGIIEGMTATQIELSLKGCSVSADSGQFMIDEAVKQGNAIMSISDQASLRRDLEHGSGEESGLFLGVPYVVRDDGRIRDSVIVLEVVTATERIGMMEQCAVDRWTVKG